MTRCMFPVRSERGHIFTCGKCLPCKIKRRTIWSVRMLHQLNSSEHASFLTLTYDERHLLSSPALMTHAGTLSKHHLQGFFKRLRRRVGKERLETTIKYYACGEYGDLGRPHYHILLFGLAPSFFNRYDDKGTKMIDHLWHHGIRNEVSLPTAARIRYCAGYIEKKFFGELSMRAYRDVEPPFQLSSNGLGLDFALNNLEVILYTACIEFKRARLPVPKVYRDKILEAFPPAGEGLADRLRLEAASKELDFILDNFPEFGGRTYEQLTAGERRSLGEFLSERSERFYKDLVSGIELKKIKSEVSHV